MTSFSSQPELVLAVIKLSMLGTHKNRLGLAFPFFSGLNRGKVSICPTVVLCFGGIQNDDTFLRLQQTTLLLASNVLTNAFVDS